MRNPKSSAYATQKHNAWRIHRSAKREGGKYYKIPALPAGRQNPKFKTNSFWDLGIGIYLVVLVVFEIGIYHMLFQISSFDIRI